MQNIKPLQTSKKIMSNKEAMEELERYNPKEEPKESKPQIIDEKTNKNLETILVTASNDGKLRIYTPPDFNLVKELNWDIPYLDIPSSNQKVVLSPKRCVCGFNTKKDIYIVAGSSYGEIGFYNSKFNLTKKQDSTKPINSVCPYYTKDGNFLVSGGDDGILRIYNDNLGLEKEINDSKKPTPINSLCTFKIDNDRNILISSGGDRMLRGYNSKFDIFCRLVYAKMDSPISIVKSINLNNNDYLVVGFNNGKLVIHDTRFNTSTGFKVAAQLKVFDSPVTSACVFNLDYLDDKNNSKKEEKLLIGSEDNPNIKVINKNLKLEKASLYHSKWMANLMVSIGSKYFAIGWDKRVGVYEFHFGLIKEKELNEATDRIWDMCCITKEPNFEFKRMGQLEFYRQKEPGWA